MTTKNGITYKVDLVPVWKYPIKCPEYMTPKKVTIHNTDNEMGAQAEINYMKSNDNETSYHIAIDEVEAIQGLPFNRNGWHSGDGFNGYGNRNTIGFEICRNYDRKRGTTNLHEPLNSMYTKAEQNAIKIVPQIMIEQGIVASYDTVKKHQDWSGKWCPSKILNEGRWRALQTAIIAEYIRLAGGKVEISGATHKPAPKPAVKVTGIVSVKDEIGSFKANDTIYVRDKPSVSGKHIATYHAGEVLDKYIKIHSGNGYLWLEYNRPGKPHKGFIPIRTYNSQTGKYGETWGEVRDVGGFNTPVKKVEYVFLPGNNDKWGVYYLNQAPVASNIQGKYLRPSLFNGIEYKIIRWDSPNVAVINTDTYKQVKIYVGPDTNAKIYKK